MHRNKSLRLNQTNSPAFTVVELMIVIIIISLLATLAYLSYNGVQRNALIVTRKMDLQNLSNAMGLFYKDNNRYPYMNVGSATPEFEAILKEAQVFDTTRKPDAEKTFIFCEPNLTDPQAYAIIWMISDAVDTTAPQILHYVTSNDAPSSTPLVMNDAISASNPNGKLSSNACNTISLKTGRSYFTTSASRWSFDTPVYITSL